MFVFDPDNTGTPSQFPQIRRQIRKSLKRDLERLDVHAIRQGKFVAVGGAPSVANFLGELRSLRNDPKNKIATVNRAHNWLIENGIVPDYCVLFEVNADPRAVDQIPHEDVTYLIASHCDQSCFEHFKDSKVIMWHCFAGAGEDKLLAKLEPGAKIVGGGITTILKTLNIGLIKGFREFEMFGVDSSFNGSSHVYHDTSPEYVTKREMDVVFNDKTYHSSYFYARQAYEFAEFCKRHHHMFNMRVHGEGLLPDIHRHLAPQFYEEDHENQSSGRRQSAV